MITHGEPLSSAAKLSKEWGPPLWGAGVRRSRPPSTTRYLLRRTATSPERWPPAAHTSGDCAGSALSTTSLHQIAGGAHARATRLLADFVACCSPQQV